MPERWEGATEEDSWWIEVESDCFAPDEPVVVALWTENEEQDNPKPVQTLATLSPQQAREMATALSRLADHVEQANEKLSTQGRQIA